DQRSLPEGRRDELPALADSGQLRRLPLRLEGQADRWVRVAILQELADHGLVGEADDVVEVLARVLGVATRVGAAEDGDGSLRSKQVAQRVGKERGLGKSA